MTHEKDTPKPPGGKRYAYDTSAILKEMRQQYWQGLEEQEESSSIAAKDYLVFSLCGQSFAIPTHIAREVLRPPRLVPVPRIGQMILGIINLRGQVLAVTDLCPLLGLKRQGDVATGRLVVVEAEGLTTALAVDEVAGIHQYPDDAIEPLAQGPGGMSSSVTSGQIKQEDGLLILLKMEQILASGDLVIDHKKV